MNENNQDMQNDGNESGVKIWLEDNLRVLLSILIVVAIAGGIYSYSKRSQSPTVTDDTTQETQDSMLEKIVSGQDGSTDQDMKNDSATQNRPSVSTDISKETEASFIESAQRGEGATHLARRATANYLEKNPDSTLTREHKIFIEDYLRKNVKKTDRMNVGSSVEFQKDLIRSAIEKSKTLNEKQLQNLKKYSTRAPSLK